MFRHAVKTMEGLTQLPVSTYNDTGRYVTDQKLQNTWQIRSVHSPLRGSALVRRCDSRS